MNFSIIIPAKNEQSNIGRCLDSILDANWDRSHYEIIVVDNGSTDDTVEIANARGASVFVRPGETIAALRNLGARQANGEVLAFLDADCAVEGNWLREAARYLAMRDVVCFGSPPRVPDDATWVQTAWYAVRRKRGTVCETEWLESMNMFVRRDTFLECGGFDESLATCEDYDLSLRLRKEGRVVSDSRIVAIHHGEAATIGHFFRKELWRGKSNFMGLMQHGFSLSEAPSLLAPSIHCLLLIWSPLSLLLLGSDCYRYGIGVAAMWQGLLLLKSFRTQWPGRRLQPILQLYCLLNVYLFARGVSVFQRN